MKFPSFQNKHPGVVSVYVLLLLLLLLMIGLGLFTVQLGSLSDAQNAEDLAQARLLAQTALQEGRYYSTRINSSWSGTSAEQTMNVGGVNVGSYDYTVAKCSNIYDITGNGYIPSKTASRKISQALTLRYRNPNPYTILNDGFESGGFGATWTQDNDGGTSWSVISSDAPNNGTYHAKATKAGNGTATARLISPTYDLSCYDQVVVRFSYKRDDGSSFTLSMNNGSGWTSLYSDSSNKWEGAYTRPSVRVTITSGFSSTVQFRFEGRMGKNDEWYLDDVLISTPYALYDSTVDT
ncbi:MAG: choice-of-anchor J domain-containing protein [Deltaproteobacteria bacterium]|nr:choice-of-anchor J domain-containing protein [Deltaproteobacteria bacterium]